MNEAKMLGEGEIGILPTDTIYGLVASAHLPEAVERVYLAKGRAPEKPCIILISSVEDLHSFGISNELISSKALGEYWPGPVSIIFPCTDEALRYLHRGTNTLAFRLPKDEWLVFFLEVSGPVIAPSANPQGLPPAVNVEEARNYFGNQVNFYIDKGERKGNPSKVISMGKDGSVEVLRA
ncbi:MAG: hypothetical protein JWL75_659 [Parcubacteria group bacterium]|nr:hypothetical protein [Parcubacteria group bacterium]